MSNLTRNNFINLSFSALLEVLLASFIGCFNKINSMNIIKNTTEIDSIFAGRVPIKGTTRGSSIESESGEPLRLMGVVKACLYYSKFVKISLKSIPHIFLFL
ncbi:MAG: hypothetical protein ACYCXO_05825 [Candidatus Humimicrobiaceae bacterium]